MSTTESNTSMKNCKSFCSILYTFCLLIFDIFCRKRHDKTLESLREQQEKYRETVMKLESMAQAQGAKAK